MPDYQLIIGHCLSSLLEIPDKSVHCVVTSPPYFGLRDYGIPPVPWPSVEFRPIIGLPTHRVDSMSSTLGLEHDPWAFVAHMVLIFREVRRVLRDDGTVWINMGDSYASNAGGYDKSGNQKNRAFISKNTQRATPQDRKRSTRSGVKEKNLYGMPWRLALALQADGWFLRQGLIWEKPNPMPESIKDRFTLAHEDLFLLTKSAKYYFNQDAVREPAVSAAEAFHNNGVGFGHGTDRAARGRDRQVWAQPAGWDDGDGAHGTIHRDGSRRNSFAGEAKDTAGEHGQKPQHRPDREEVPCGITRNKRSVWKIPPAPYGGKHFATFPPDLVEPCILAGCPEKGTVLDIFGGTGTVAGVALLHGRNAILLEISHEYANLVPDRINSILARLAPRRQFTFTFANEESTHDENV